MFFSEKKVCFFGIKAPLVDTRQDTTRHLAPVVISVSDCFWG